MRTYLIDSERNEYIIDLTRTVRHSSYLVEFEYCAICEGKPTHRENLFVRKLAGNYYISSDRLRWRKLARQHFPKKILNVDKIFDVYRGYRPSGLTSSAAGELLTQMPGKVVKINVKVGQEVKAGDCVLILEAMKMENEIKSAVDGVVKTISVKEGDTLDSGVLMMEVE